MGQELIRERRLDTGREPAPHRIRHLLSCRLVRWMCWHKSSLPSRQENATLTPTPGSLVRSRASRRLFGACIPDGLPL
jgi:hypothetical protein